jgi:hypothetical protein
MKRIVIASIITFTAFSAFALDEKSAIKIARNYSESIACQLEETQYEAAQVNEGDSEQDGFGALYVVYWTGDVGCSGGNGTVMPNFTVVEHRGFTSADPIVVTDYEFPDLRINNVTGFSSKNGVLRIEGLAYGKNDQQGQPNQRVVYRLRFDGDKFVMD